jgi:YggT family protein
MFLLSIIHFIVTALTLLVIADVVLSYFMSPYHPIREIIDRLVAPMLDPIRRIMPQTGMVDFSPLVLIILLQLVEYVLSQLIAGL